MHQLQIGDLAVNVVRKDIRNVHLAVLPPDGQVRVAAPLRVGDEAVRLLVATRRAWIRQQQAKFAGQARETPREYLSGESHYYAGRRYRLVVHYEPGPARIEVRGTSYLDMYVRLGATTEQRATVLREWYREQLKEQLPALVTKWEAVVGEHAGAYAIKHMKTKWGTCNIAARRVWLNLELAKKPVRCIEYVLVHELTHLLERNHNERFRALLDKFMPQWRVYRSELNDGILAAFEEYGAG